MTQISADFPQLLAARGLKVYTMGNWEQTGGAALHDAVVLHHTASSTGVRPADDAAYCHHGSKISPLYNVLCDRNGAVWVMARGRSNNAGQISSVALNEVLMGRADPVPAGQRGLRDDTSANSRLFAICGQNNGTSEPWSPALVNAMATVAAVALGSLGLPHAGYVTSHRALTKRKVDPCGPGCPDNWQPAVNSKMSMAPAKPGPPLVGKRELMLIEHPGRTKDPNRLACLELRPDDYQILGWNGASVKGDFVLKPGDNQRRGECLVLDIKAMAGGKNVLGWKADGTQGVLFVTDGDGGTFHVAFS